jgi:hypothetical protein
VGVVGRSQRTRGGRAFAGKIERSSGRKGQKLFRTETRQRGGHQQGTQGRWHRNHGAWGPSRSEWWWW